MRWNAGYPLIFNMLWVLPVLIGCSVGYMAFRTIQIDLAIAALVGMFFLSTFQHCIHVSHGASSTVVPYPELKIYAKIYALIITVIGIYIVINRPYALMGIAAGILTAVAYTKIHKEEFWSLGHAISMPTACYIATGHLNVPIGLILVGIALIMGAGLFSYRALTGDYDNVPRMPILQRFVSLYLAGLLVTAVGFALA